ncbi:MAG: hypothetical protein PF551_03935 [Candidatus Marinimicrobia bacterium]|jgi:hypothetical protein|nr:hypothetical protein [Candidatus Neomarinimicrobiota bacterium]
MKSIPKELIAKFSPSNQDTYLRPRMPEVNEKYNKDKSQIIWKHSTQQPIQGHSIILDILNLNHEYLLRYGNLIVDSMSISIEKNKIIDKNLENRLLENLTKTVGRTHLRFQQELSTFKKRYNLDPSVDHSIIMKESSKWSNTLIILQNQLKEEIILYNENTEAKDLLDSNYKPKKTTNEYYIDPQRIQSFKKLKHADFNFNKLINLLEELNINFHHGKYNSLLLLQRALLDHVPPIFNRNNFKDFYNHLQNSEKKYYKKLDDDLRDLADSIIHKQIDKTKIQTPTLFQVDFRNKIDRLLGDVLSKFE